MDWTFWNNKPLLLVKEKGRRETIGKLVSLEKASFSKPGKSTPCMTLSRDLDKIFTMLSTKGLEEDISFKELEKSIREGKALVMTKRPLTMGATDMIGAEKRW